MSDSIPKLTDVLLFHIYNLFGSGLSKAYWSFLRWLFLFAPLYLLHIDQTFEGSLGLFDRLLGKSVEIQFHRLRRLRVSIYVELMTILAFYADVSKMICWKRTLYALIHPYLLLRLKDVVVRPCLQPASHSLLSAVLNSTHSSFKR
jgi:hypothetical protein